MAAATGINPEILKWARETAGMTAAAAAKRIGLRGSLKHSAVGKLAALEAGEAAPTQRQLLRIARAYRRPATVFYLAKPPPPGPRGVDFRAVGAEATPEEAALLEAFVRDIRVRRDIVRSLVEDDEDRQPLEFVGSLAISVPVRQACARTRDLLGIDAGKTAPGLPFPELRRRVEALGIYVLLIGNLGSWHTRIATDLFRGLALSDPLAPFIVINDADSKPAQCFTLIHEFVHILLDAPGVSAAPSTEHPNTETARVERFCNDAAGEFLLPETALEAVAGTVDWDEALAIIGDLSKQHRVSSSMAAYRLWRTERITAALYGQLTAFYQSRWRKSCQASRAGSTSSPGPYPWTVWRNQLGAQLLTLVDRSLRTNELTHTKASRLLGVQPGSVEPLIGHGTAVSGN